MRILIIFFIFLLLLTGCGADPSSPSENISTTDPITVEENEDTEKKVFSDNPSEIPVSIRKQEETTSDTLENTVIDTVILEGLVEDAVSFSFYIPVVSECDAAEKINDYYSDLSGSLQNYAETTVYEACLDRHTVADVTGCFETVSNAENELQISYTVQVKFADSDQPDSFSRTDHFDSETGELLSSEQS